MTYTIGRVRRWDAGGVTTTSSTVAGRRATAEEARRILGEGWEKLAGGWEGVAAEAVLDAAEAERAHVTKLADGLADLADVLARAAAALGPAVQSVRDRIAGAESAGLVVGEDSVGPAPGREDVTQDTVDSHVEALGMALDTVRSLDQHYGREIDAVAARLHQAIPPVVDRRPIPGPDSTWPGVAADAVTGAVQAGAEDLADGLDPATRGRHVLDPVPDELGRRYAGGLRGLGRLAGPLGAGLTVYDGIEGYVSGETTAGEAAAETTGALGGGMAGGALAGAAAGSFLGPAGTAVGAGIGAAVGAWAGKEAVDRVYDAVLRDGSDDTADGGGN